MSALLDWGEHRFAQEVGLLRDVLLHGSTMLEILQCFQWYSFMAVITKSYESFAINGMDHQNLPSSLSASLPYKLLRIDLVSCSARPARSH
jgi:hypothetical protein